MQPPLERTGVRSLEHPQRRVQRAVRVCRIPTLRKTQQEGESYCSTRRSP